MTVKPETRPVNSPFKIQGLCCHTQPEYVLDDHKPGREKQNRVLGLPFLPKTPKHHTPKSRRKGLRHTHFMEETLHLTKGSTVVEYTILRGLFYRYQC